MGAAASMSSKKSLLNGATAGDAYRVRITLAGMRATAGWVVNSLTDKAGTPLLTLAVRSGSAETVQHLLKVRADPTKATGQAGDTPLLVLAQGRRSGEADKETLAIAKLLIDAKANVNFVNAFSQTALYQCSGRKDTALAQYLIHRGANANFWSKTFSRSLLMEYFEKQASAENLEMLISHGAELSAKEREKILHTCAAGDYEVLELLVDKAGAGKPHMEAKNARGENALHLVCARAQPNVKAARLLLRSGVDMELPTVKGATPLILALLHNKSSELVLYLLDKRADANHATPANTTPLLVASRAPLAVLSVVQALLKSGANVNHQENVTRQTSLHMLAARDDCDTMPVIEAARTLLQHGGSPSIRDRDGRLPLHTAYQTAGRHVRTPRESLMIRLLLANAGEDDVTTKDYSGVTPLAAYEHPDEYDFEGGGEHQHARGGDDFEFHAPAVPRPDAGWGKPREADRLELEDLSDHDSSPQRDQAGGHAHLPGQDQAASQAGSENHGRIGEYLKDAREKAGGRGARAAGGAVGGNGAVARPGRAPPLKGKFSLDENAWGPTPPAMLDDDLLASLARPRRR